MTDIDPDRKVAVVTGVARGIGHAIATLFMSHGWAVVGIDVEEGAPVTGMRFFRGDVGVPRDVEAAFVTVRQKEGRVDALVNNAAVQICRPFQQTTVAEWDRLMAVNVRGPFLTSKAAFDLFPAREKGGAAVVNVASVHALATSPDFAAYASSKGAVVALTRAMALELAPRGVRVNAVLPGAVDTSMLREALEPSRPPDASMEEHLDQFGGQHPLGRIGRPEDIAQAVLFLADDTRSSFVTGQTLVVDGGILARLDPE